MDKELHSKVKVLTLQVAHLSGSLDGFPTAPAASVPSISPILRRAPWDHPNPDTGLCDCPDTRSTAEIVWTCASTLIIAAWISVHLNVPPKGASPFRLAVLRFGAMFATILGPEVTLKWAFTEWSQARTLQKEMVKRYPAWTRTHSFYVVMGGFALYDKKEKIYCPIHPDNFPIEVGQKFALPTISEEEIKDKSKGDGLTKTIAIFQLLWFSVQLIGRLAKGWAATELEVLTFATCIMTVIIYFFWWNKPLDVHCQTILQPIQSATDGPGDCDDSVKQEERREYPPVIGFFKQFKFFRSHPTPRQNFHRWIFEHTSSLTFFLKLVFFPFVCLWGALDGTWEGWGPDCAAPTSAAERMQGDEPTLLMVIFASVFGGMYFITWSFSMPTVTELWMWRSASIALTSLPILATLCLLVANSLQNYSRSISVLTTLIGLAFLVLHPIIRLVIAVDSVVLLRNLPDTAFLVLSWSDDMPSL